VIEIVVDRLALTGSVNFIGTAQKRLTPEGRRSWRQERRIPICTPMIFYRTIPACGRRCNRSAAGPGKAVYTIQIKLSRLLTPVKKRSVFN
jgi:hypothetical protein